MLSKLNQYVISTFFTVNLNRPDSLCYVAIIPFVVLIATHYIEIEDKNIKHFIWIICSAIQLGLFAMATSIWIIRDLDIHIISIILVVIWLIFTLKYSFRFGYELGKKIGKRIL